MKLYGLFSKEHDCLMGFSIRSNEGGDFCNDTQVELTSWSEGEMLWTTTSKEHAEKISKSEVSWFNSSPENPQRDKYWGTLEVVDLNEFEVKE